MAEVCHPADLNQSGGQRLIVITFEGTKYIEELDREQPHIPEALNLNVSHPLINKLYSIRIP